MIGSVIPVVGSILILILILVYLLGLIAAFLTLRNWMPQWPIVVRFRAWLLRLEAPRPPAPQGPISKFFSYALAVLIGSLILFHVLAWIVAKFLNLVQAYR